MSLCIMAAICRKDAGLSIADLVSFAGRQFEFENRLGRRHRVRSKLELHMYLGRWVPVSGWRGKLLFQWDSEMPR